MVNKLLSRFMLTLGTLGISIASIGQPPRGPLVISPQVSADNRVTFRYLAPSANEQGQLAESRCFSDRCLGLAPDCRRCKQERTAIGRDESVD